MKSICVFCGSSEGNDPVFIKSAQQLAELLVSQNIDLIYGGASVGMMGALANEVIRLGGKASGVIPKPIFEKEVAHRGLTELYVVKSMHERKQMMYDLSDGFIAMPGGIGTLEELFEILTWAQLGLHKKPCGVFNVENYFDSILNFLNQALEKGFIKEKYKQLFLNDSDPQKLLEKMKRYSPILEKKWMDKKDL